MSEFHLPPHLFPNLAAHQLRRLEAQRWAEPTDSLARQALEGGKFLRPQLFFTVLAAFDSASVWSQAYFDVALSIEWIHAYSLIHDDLPCMDNDDFRRGRPTLHRLSNEAQALLVGDALLTGAFQLLSNAPALNSSLRIDLVRELSFAAGGGQLIAGQVRDLQSQYHSALSDVMQTHVLKTGALFGAAAAMAAQCVKSHDLGSQVDEFRKWGRDFGILYQLIDDFLDRDGAALLLPASALRAEIMNRMESLSDRALALGWNPKELLDRFESLMWVD